MKEGIISHNEKQALDQLASELNKYRPGIKIKLFGSKVKGTANQESDLDMLILLPSEVTQTLRRQIIHKIFDLNLVFETNISCLIFSEKEWNSERFSKLLFRNIVEEEGVDYDAGLFN